MDGGSRSGPAATALVLGPAVGASVAALLAGRLSALAGAVLATLALGGLAIWAGRGGRRPAAVLAASIGLSLAILAACWPEIRPLPSAPEMLSRGVGTLESRWNDLVRRLDGAASDVPPPGSDYAWMGERLQTLGARAGIAVMTPDAAEVLAWRGWTTRLSDAERVTLLERTGADGGLIVLRRGFALRLLHARSVLDDEGRVIQLVAAESPLADEPSPGALAEGLHSALVARVRWEAIGEGVRAEIGIAAAPADRIAGTRAGAGPVAEPRDVPLWSLVPLMSARGRLAGRVSLGLTSSEAWRRAQAERRRALVAIALGGFLLLLVGSGSLPWWTLVPARAILLLPNGWVARASTARGEAAWLPFPELDGAPAWTERLWHTPLDAALTGLTIVGLAALVPMPRRTRERGLVMALGVAVLALGLLVSWRLTSLQSIAPGEILLLPFDRIQPRLAATLTLLSLPWAGALILFRGARPAGRRWIVYAAILAGLVTGALHGAALSAAARRVAETELAGRVKNRAEIWTAALLDTLETAVPSRPGEVLTPDRDAIDLWWNSPLGRLGLASGLWKFEAGDAEAPVDAFLTGIPPVTLPSRLTTEDTLPIGPFPRGESGPVLEAVGFVEGNVDLLVAEVQRPNGGAWVAAVLVEPGNLPGRSRADPLRGSRAGAPDRPGLRPAGLEPRLAWFDESGAQLATDIDPGPPAPRAPPPEPRWRRTDIEGRSVRLLEMPDSQLRGTVTAIVVPLDPLARSALAVAWSLLLAFLTLACIAGRALLSAPLATARSVGGAVRGLATHFRGQLAVAFVAVGLLALLALAGAGRATARRQAIAQVNGEGARLVHFARKLVEDIQVLVPEGPLQEGPTDEADEVAAWFARTLGEDVSVWRSGTLIATSRPDLVRAGLWPERLPGQLWDAVAGARRPLVVESFRLRDGPPPVAITVAHGPFRTPDGEGGVVSIPLGSAGARLTQQLADIDRALLVSSVLLVALSILLLVPATRRLVAPLAILERATARIAGGEFDTPVPEVGYEETRTLARAFKAMTASLASQRRSLERRRQAIETLIESMPVAVAAFAGRSTIASNPKARELLGLASNGLSPGGGPLRAAVHELRASRGETVRTIEIPAVDGERESRLMRVVGIDLPELIDGEPARLIVIEDLTDALRAERLTAWAEMARRIAHEIKNPLTPISLMVEHVRRMARRGDPRLSGTLEECLTTIADQVGVLRDTSREFSDYARLLVPHPSRIDLRAELGRWLAPYLTAPPEGVTLELVGQEELSPIEADPRLLRRAVMNLVDNALTAVRGGGTVRVSWKLDEPAGTVRISVEDTGPGIDPDSVAGLFEADVTTRDFGSGLGLPIVREAVEAHGGRVDVDPGPGVGARFTIVLPAAGRTAAPVSGEDD